MFSQLHPYFLWILIFTTAVAIDIVQQTGKTISEAYSRRHLSKERIFITEHNAAANPQNIHLHNFLAKINETLDEIVDANIDKLATAYYRGNSCPFKRKVFDKMMHGETVKIIIVGGSVTYGAELKDRLKQRWSYAFSEYLNSGWYKGKFDIVNIGVGACNIDVWIYRVKELVSADLVIVDLSVNDQGFDLQALPHLYETYIQLIDKLPNRPALFFNQAFRGAKHDMGDIRKHCPTDYISCCNGELFCHRWWEMQDFVGITLHKYKIPFISYRDLAWPDYYHPPSHLNQFWNGLSHPDYKAHALLAKLYAYGFFQQVKESHHIDWTKHCLDKDRAHYVGKDTRNPHVTPLCSSYSAVMMATDSPVSQSSFTLSSAFPSSRFWRFYNDSQLKYGYILETNKEQIQQICGKETLPERVYQPVTLDSFLCPLAIDQHALHLSLDFPSTTLNPKIQLTFLKSYAEEMGEVLLWLDEAKQDSVLISGKWEMEYSVSHVATISKEALTNVSAFLKGDNYVMPSLTSGKHTLHVSVGKILAKEGNFKWKLIGVSIC